jgi:hypothetical protein
MARRDMDRLRMHLRCEFRLQLRRDHPVLVRDDIKGRLLLPGNRHDFGTELIWAINYLTRPLVFDTFSSLENEDATRTKELARSNRLLLES